MKHKVSELEGTALDAAVAMAESLSGGFLFQKHYNPSTEWAVGGPIIERELIAIHGSSDGWDAYVRGSWDYSGMDADPVHAQSFRAPTPLFAAMRAYVKSKFGEEIELP